jgi:hypothetical protein
MDFSDNPFGAELGDLASTPLAQFESALRACLVRNHGFAALPTNQVLEIYSTSLLGCSGDDPQRYGLSLPRLVAFNGETVRRLQSEVLDKFPEWTIVLAQECDEYKEVAISRDEVRTDNDTVVNNVQEFMEELQLLARRSRERVEGAVLRQLAYLRPKIPSMIHMLSDETPCVVVAAFDNWRGDTERLCIWSLSETTDWNIAVPGTHGASGGSFPVTEDGLVVSREPDSKAYRQLRSTAGIWLVQNVIPASYLGDAFVCEGPIPSDGSKPQEIPVSIDRSAIIRDLDLPRVELP